MAFDRGNLGNYCHLHPLHVFDSQTGSWEVRDYSLWGLQERVAFRRVRLAHRHWPFSMRRFDWKMFNAVFSPVQDWSRLAFFGRFGSY